MTVPAFPGLVPTSRSFDPGDFPIKTYNAQNGAEVRIKYGNRRINRKLQLTYANVTDTEIVKFIDHYADAGGTLNTFEVPLTTFDGWEGGKSRLTPGGPLAYRYAKPPVMTQVAKGRSTVTVDLVMISQSSDDS
ncbi:phage minor tail protein [uncultured Mediterranean phage MEDS2 group]|nr:phage minor tail protein [uncultured Mediterranean phage MEDS2 group]